MCPAEPTGLPPSAPTPPAVQLAKRYCLSGDIEGIHHAPNASFRGVACPHCVDIEDFGIIIRFMMDQPGHIASGHTSLGRTDGISYETYNKVVTYIYSLQPEA